MNSLHDFLEQFRRITFYVYAIEDTVVGVAALGAGQDGVAQIRWAYVLPQHQRRGVGPSLMNHLENEAKKAKFKRLWLFTNNKAYWAKGFYSKLGCRVIDRISRPWGDDAIYTKTLVREGSHSRIPFLADSKAFSKISGNIT